MATIKVVHKQVAYIGGRSYRPGDEADIDENDFNETVHEKVSVLKPDKHDKPPAGKADFT